MKKEKTESMELHHLNKSERRPTWSSEYIYPETALDRHADRSDENSASEQSHDDALRSFTPLDSPRTSKYPLETIPSNKNNRTILDRSSFTSSTCINNPESAKEMAEPQAKRSIFQKALLSLPPFAHVRKTVKASLALLISFIFCLDSHTREIFGTAVLLTAIVTIFYFPVRTIGKRKKKKR